MRLEKIILNGFKSFADKTEFVFDQEITAIVGPNGCGKSNVVDAMKWVLGNQSPKQLRSGQMTDVIFSGSSSRKASGMAQVSLCFSQVESLGLEQDSLEISRRLYRSGESEYLINNKSCRLKDIRELFMDTGIGVSAYSIIEQGQIDQLLHASKVDRRIIFEEAAGISKFKAHKKEASRKLDRTEQNLLRLADIVSEVQKQLRSVKLQAGKARNYLVYADRLKELRVNYSLAEYDKIITQTKSKKESLFELEAQFGSISAYVAKLDTEVSTTGSQIIQSESEINRLDNTLIATKGKIEQQHERIKFLKGRMQELSERKVNASAQIKRLTGQTSGLTGELAQCQDELEESQRLFESRKQELTDLEEVLHEMNSELGSIEAQLEDEKSGIIDIVRRTAQLHNEIQSISTYRDNLSGQKEKLHDRVNIAKNQLAGMLTEKAQHQAKLDDIISVLDQLQQSLDEKRNQIQEIDVQLATDNEQLAQEKEQRSALRSELNVLNDMEAKREGLSDSLKEILSGGQYDFIDGILADVIHADSSHAAIIEAALEGLTDALIINSTSEFLNSESIISGLDSRISVVCTDKLEPFADNINLSEYPSVHGRLIEFVNFDSKYSRLAWNLLGHTILVDSLDAATELSVKLGSKYRFVTTNAEVFENRFKIRTGPVGKARGLISRKSRINELEQETGKITAIIQDLENHMEQNHKQNDHLTKLCKDFRTSIYEANTEKVDCESRLRILENNIKRLTDEQPVLSSEINLLEQEISTSVQKEHDSKQKLDELEIINTQRTEHIEDLETQYDEKKAMQETQASLCTEMKIRIGQFTEQQKGLRQRISGLQSQLQHSRMSIESARTEVLGCEEQVTQTERNILASESKISELFVEKDKAQKVSEKMHKEISEMQGIQREKEAILKQKCSEQDDIEQKINQLRLELGQLQVKDEDLTQRVQEELQINLSEAYKNFDQEDVDWEEVRKEISELRSKIQRIGNVNVDAIEQQAELEKRDEFLTTQIEDLNSSKKQLEQLIDKIDKESIDLFRTTFEEVRNNFVIIFRKLFGGGKADILLEDPDNILDCGIEIVARPPGKETRSISLLSGGEKTMTAISLLFSVFKSKPSPFCFLDEVDAALDEANNERFNMIVQEFKKDSQFVIVSHSKRTMSIADVLFGVTMQTKGVSKKISVQFDRIDEIPDSAVA